MPVDNGARKLLKSAVRQYMPSDREWAAGGVVGGLVAIFAAAAVATLLVWEAATKSLPCRCCPKP